MPNENAPARRGAPRPLRDEDLIPPPHLTPTQRELFLDAVRSRPGFWTPSDIILLECYAVAAAFVREAHLDMTSITPSSYRQALLALRSNARELRLSPYGRQREYDRVAPPKGNGAEAASSMMNGRPPAQDFVMPRAPRHLCGSFASDSASHAATPTASAMCVAGQPGRNARQRSWANRTAAGCRVPRRTSAAIPSARRRSSTGASQHGNPAV